MDVFPIENGVPRPRINLSQLGNVRWAKGSEVVQYTEAGSVMRSEQPVVERSGHVPVHKSSPYLRLVSEEQETENINVPLYENLLPDPLSDTEDEEEEEEEESLEGVHSDASIDLGEGTFAGFRLREIYDRIDIHGRNKVTRAQLIHALQVDDEVRRLMHLPASIRQASSHTDFELLFQTIDATNTRGISWEDFRDAFFSCTLSSFRPKKKPSRMPRRSFLSRKKPRQEPSWAKGKSQAQPQQQRSGNEAEQQQQPCAGERSPQAQTRPQQQAQEQNTVRPERKVRPESPPYRSRQFAQPQPQPYLHYHPASPIQQPRQQRRPKQNERLLEELELGVQSVRLEPQPADVVQPVTTGVAHTLLQPHESRRVASRRAAGPYREYRSAPVAGYLQHANTHAMAHLQYEDREALRDQHRAETVPPSHPHAPQEEESLTYPPVYGAAANDSTQQAQNAHKYKYPNNRMWPVPHKGKSLDDTHGEVRSEETNRMEPETPFMMQPPPTPVSPMGNTLRNLERTQTVFAKGNTATQTSQVQRPTSQVVHKVTTDVTQQTSTPMGREPQQSPPPLRTTDDDIEHAEKLFVVAERDLNYGDTRLEGGAQEEALKAYQNSFKLLLEALEVQTRLRGEGAQCDASLNRMRHYLVVCDAVKQRIQDCYCLMGKDEPCTPALHPLSPRFVSPVKHAPIPSPDPFAQGGSPSNLSPPRPKNASKRCITSDGSGPVVAISPSPGLYKTVLTPTPASHNIPPQPCPRCSSVVDRHANFCQICGAALFRY